MRCISPVDHAEKPEKAFSAAVKEQFGRETTKSALSAAESGVSALSMSLRSPKRPSRQQ
ncbi:hypothetical protein [Paenibacillus alginolyticus]|uniref:hypothetical protein n=1 Tax=Paenibacillus alginolyticus TaxID=59839 RepID=UPI002DB6562D|nr:hypothetical protein [Paenibacillus alginolyticus]MEC0146789.1 hypothetical protein [Paenibacillus alginolyticus]